jgi:hypothetical protein
MTYDRLILLVVGLCFACVLWAYRLQVQVATWERVGALAKQLEFQRLP